MEIFPYTFLSYILYYLLSYNNLLMLLTFTLVTVLLSANTVTGCDTGVTHHITTCHYYEDTSARYLTRYHRLISGR